MKTVLINDENLSSKELEDVLAEEGHEISMRADMQDVLLNKVKLTDAELMLLNVEQLDQGAVKQLRLIAQQYALPIVIFAKCEGDVKVSEVVKSGVSAYVVDGLNKQRVRPIIEVALARFSQFKSLVEEVVNAKQALQERKDIERAKGILMKQKSFSEDEAYKVLRKAAMDQNKRIADIAKSIIGLSQILA